MTDVLQSHMLDRGYPKTNAQDDIQYYEERLSKRKEKEREEQKLNQFLNSSLRSSDRLRALEKSNKKNYKMNPAYEPENFDSEIVRLDIDIIRFTEALCGRKYNKSGIARSDLEWIQKYIQSDIFQNSYKTSIAIQEILIRYNHPPLTGKSVAQKKLKKVVSILNSAQTYSKESHYKYQMQELLQILSNPDLKALCYANDECAKTALVIEELRTSQTQELSDVELNNTNVSLPKEKIKTIPPEISPQIVKKQPESTVRIIKSTISGCYAQIHLTERDIPIKTVVLEKGKYHLGATVRNERDAVVIGRLVMGGIAYKSGLLNEGDELLSVNDLELTGKDVNEVSDILARMTGTVKFTVASVNNVNYGLLSRPLSNTTIHLKALFSYKPDDDVYMPCIDIGLSFNRGDVLHVTNVQDPNWWQAYRDDDGRDSGSVGELAGLIPSPDYQYQREVIRKRLSGENSAFNIYASTRQQSSILCLKKSKKNNSNYSNGWVYNVDIDGKTSNSETTKRKIHKKKRSTYCPGELELNQVDPNINTYEEVQMFIPQPHRKRPIVLVGPELIGRHDLLSRIIKSDPEQFSIVKQHTTLDNKSSEFKNVSKEEFKHLLNQEEFIETAMFEKNWYGISKTEVKGVIDSGKTAVFVLQPESLRIIRKTNFLPFVIFVSPPTTVELLRQLRIKLEKQRPPDDELITTIDRANAIDMMFGQFFDTVLTVQSLENATEIALNIIRGLDRDPQWVPSRWLGQRPMSQMSLVH